MFREHELVKAKATTNWQIEEQACVIFFVHIIKELHGGDLIPQAFVEFNGPLHLNWVGLRKQVNQLIINKQPIWLTIQTTLLKKIFEEILKDINMSST